MVVATLIYHRLAKLGLAQPQPFPQGKRRKPAVQRPILQSAMTCHDYSLRPKTKMLSWRRMFVWARLMHHSVGQRRHWPKSDCANSTSMGFVALKCWTHHHHLCYFPFCFPSPSISFSFPLSLSLWLALSLSPDFFGKRVGLSTSQALYITIDSSNAHHQEHDLSIHSHPSNGLPFRALLGLKCRTPMDPTTIAFFIQLPVTGIIDDFLGSLGSFYDFCWGILQNPTVAPNQF